MNYLFESLSMNVSEECFNDIMDIVEEIISERNAANKAAKDNYEAQNKQKYYSTGYYAGQPERSIEDIKAEKHWKQQMVRKLKQQGEDEAAEKAAEIASYDFRTGAGRTGDSNTSVQPNHYLKKQNGVSVRPKKKLATMKK